LIVWIEHESLVVYRSVSLWEPLAIVQPLETTPNTVVVKYTGTSYTSLLDSKTLDVNIGL